MIEYFPEARHAAKAIAEWTLAGHYDKQGVPTIDHVSRVEARVKDAGGTHEQRIAALLHDSIEDGADKIDYATIRRLFGRDVADIVRAVTRWPEPALCYRTYIERIESYPPALLVKLCDLEDNLDEAVRGVLQDPIERERLRTRYLAARDKIREMMAVA